MAGLLGVTLGLALLFSLAPADHIEDFPHHGRKRDEHQRHELRVGHRHQSFGGSRHAFRSHGSFLLQDADAAAAALVCVLREPRVDHLRIPSRTAANVQGRLGEGGKARS